MRILVVGAGAMGSALGAKLFEGGHSVTLLDVDPELVEKVRADGLVIETPGGKRTVSVSITNDPGSLEPAELVLVFTKAYHTEAAMRFAAPAINANTMVLTLQNGWGNIDRIARVIPREQIVAGVTYHSAAVIRKGHIFHGGQGPTFVGAVVSGQESWVARIAEAFRQGELEVHVADHVLTEIWKKLVLNAVTLPLSALTRRDAGQLGACEEAMAVGRLALAEACAVAKALGVELDIEERWATIRGVLQRAGRAKSSMLQDVEGGRRTEIEVINGAVVDAGRAHGVPTPVNDVLVHLIKSLEQAYLEQAV